MNVFEHVRRDALAFRFQIGDLAADHSVDGAGGGGGATVDEKCATADDGVLHGPLGSFSQLADAADWSVTPDDSNRAAS